jgi:hypothetical protein
MKHERRQEKQEDLRVKPWREFQQYCRQWCRVCKAWFRLFKALLQVLGLTLQLILKTVFWMLRLIIPIPSSPTSHQKWQRRRETGLRINPWDVAMFTFGTLCLIGYAI